MIMCLFQVVLISKFLTNKTMKAMVFVVLCVWVPVAVVEKAYKLNEIMFGTVYQAIKRLYQDTKSLPVGYLIEC